MSDERYSIEVCDDYVSIWGDLSIEEAFDFLNFFDKKGYKSIAEGNNSTLFMRRKSIEQFEEETRIKEHISSEKFYEQLYDEAKNRIQKLEKDILSLEQLIKDLMMDERKKQARIERENESLKRSQQLYNLSQDPIAIKAMEDFYGGLRISRPMTQEEKDGALNQLLNMKKYPQDIMPTIEEFMESEKKQNETNEENTLQWNN